MAEDQNRALQDKFMLRLPDGMRDDIKSAADNLDRSMNAEIIQRLKRSFDDDHDERLKIDLPGNLWNSLMADAAIHDLSMEERAIQVLAKAYDPQSGYALALEKITSISDEIADMSELISHLKQKEDADFLLYYSKVLHFKSFILYVMKSIESGGIDIADHAREALVLCDSEIAILRDRRERAEYIEHFVARSRSNQQEIDDSSTAENVQDVDK